MQSLFTDPIISHFFQSIKPIDKLPTLKQLILLGIHIISSQIHGFTYCPCKNHMLSSNRQHHDHLAQPISNQYQHRQPLMQLNDNQINNHLAEEIKIIHHKIDQLSANLSNHPPNTYPRSTSQPKQQLTPLHQQKITLFNQPHRSQFRHHLDDSQVKFALRNPCIYQQQKKKQKKQSLQKNYQVQKQIDEQQLRKNKQKPPQTTQQHLQHQKQLPINQPLQNPSIQSSIKLKTTQKPQQHKNKNYNNNNNISSTPFHNQQNIYQSCKRNSISQIHRSRNKTTPLYSTNVRSKIKSLIERDKQKSKTNAFIKKSQDRSATYCQFQYSDQQAFAQQTKQILKIQQKSVNKNCPIHPHPPHQSPSHSTHSQHSQSFDYSYNQPKQNNKTQQNNQQHLEDNINQQPLQHEQKIYQDTISQSSSFSKFSMNSKRQTGKISGIKK